MNRQAFQSLMQGEIDSDSPQFFRDVLTAAHSLGVAAMTGRRYQENAPEEKIRTTICWLEISFFVAPEREEITFSGVQPVSWDMNAGQNYLELPVIGFGNPIGEEQPFVWENVIASCCTFNKSLPLPIAVPVVRLAIDETRTRSVYYHLNRGTEAMLG
jgi:hypothetical protein